MLLLVLVLMLLMLLTLLLLLLLLLMLLLLLLMLLVLLMLAQNKQRFFCHSWSHSMQTTLFGYAGHPAVKRALERVFTDALTEALGGSENVASAYRAHEEAISAGDEASVALYTWVAAVESATEVAFAQLRKPETAHFEIEE
jgi:ABC-type multidrug transport system fused ATPase/permease subunit